jgi:hypothetical protein
MSLQLLDPNSDHPVELWETNVMTFRWRAEQLKVTYNDGRKVTWLDCEPAGPQMRSHP